MSLITRAPSFAAIPLLTAARKKKKCPEPTPCTPPAQPPTPKEQLKGAIDQAKPLVVAALDPIGKLVPKIDLTTLENAEIAKELGDFSTSIQTAAAAVHPFASYDNMVRAWLGTTPFYQASESRSIAPLLPGLMYKGVNAVANSQYKVRYVLGVQNIGRGKEFVSPRATRIRTGPNSSESIPVEAAYLLEDEQGRHLVVELAKSNPWDGIRLTVYAHKDQKELIDQFYDRLTKWLNENNFYKNQVLQYVQTMSGAYMDFMDGLKERSTTWADIALPHDSEKLIKANTTSFFANLDTYQKNGHFATRNLLLAGPPGTGKSMVNDILFNELKGKVTFIYVTSKSLTGAGAVAGIFDAARMLKPAVVITEDLDLVGSADRYSNGRKDILNELLNQLSGVYDNTGLVVIGSTNQPNVFDEALLRPLRFSTIVPMPLPDLDLREAILKKITRDLELAPDVDLRKLAGKTEETSGAGLTELKELAIQNAIETKSVDAAGKVRLEQRHFDAALQIIEMKKRYQEESLEESIGG